MKMRCPVCDGKGKRKDVSGEKIITCGDCYGTGELTVDEKTHFDQITATPEALAKFLIEVRDACWECGDYGQPKCPFGECVMTRRDALTWLGQEAGE